MMAWLLGGAATVAALVLMKKKPLYERYTVAKAQLSQPTLAGISYAQAVALAKELQSAGNTTQANEILALAKRKRAASGGKW